MNIKVIVASTAFCFFTYVASGQVKDIFRPLPGDELHLHNDLEKDIQNSIMHWNKGVVPYSGFVDVFKKVENILRKVRCGARR